MVGSGGFRPLPTWEEIRAAGPEGGRDPYSRAGFEARRSFTDNFAWAVPSPEAVEVIRDFARPGTILEVGAGRGLWAALVTEPGRVRVIATDAFSSHGMEAVSPEGLYAHVERLSHQEAMAKYGRADVLMLVWSPYNDPMAAETLALFEQLGGRRLVFIGESEYGCTADDAFFDRLNDRWEMVGEVDIPQWQGINDYLSLWERRR